ncbi:competence protein ComE [Fischerella muscicola CCMEE 5323]|uniref:phospholipase D n=1 Tax=Fischerella muscicola CCMEE 5323 TaxID=2019572 RepID=A0A2N6JXC3_FISMU|nr:phospholipase D-like domain-containing protein [Fischerella muscicola]PLZ85042.1 competence protein ComE [Fischerella muscicola CCMEE 5323]
MSFFSTLWRFSAVFLVILTLSACQRAKFDNKRLEPLPQDPFVQVYFNHSQSSEYLEPYRHQAHQGDNLEKLIVETISQAKSTIDVAVQELRLPKIAQALVDKQKAGIKVRVILENNYSRPWSSFTANEVNRLDKREQERYQEYRLFADSNKDGNLSQEEISQTDALVILKQAKIPLIDDTSDGSQGSSLMHHKFVVVDNRFVIVTSANFTMSDIHGDFKNTNSLGNANNLLKIDSPEIADLFTKEFNLMWGDGVGGKFKSKFGLQKPLQNSHKLILGENKITIKFSPNSPTQPWNNSSNGLIGNTLNSANKSIDIALFVFSDQRLANILETRHNDNVKIRALIESGFAYRPYSEALDMMGVSLSTKCQNQVDNRPWKNPITTVGVPILAKGDLLHHKFAVIDHKTVIAGSHNWTKAGNNSNDETLLVIENPIVAAHYLREFDRLYANSRLGIPPKIQQKIKTQTKQCQK